MLKKILHHPLLIRLLHWEYWPFHVLYAPIYPIWFWYCLKARAVFFFNTANPLIENGGFLMESKKAIYDLIPTQYYPATFLFEKDTSPDQVLETIRNGSLKYPLIAKPNIGMRGMSVKKIKDDSTLIAYIQESQVDFLVQDYIPYENEVGIFFCKKPGETAGKITGIVGKEFLTVTGNGLHSVAELLASEKRYKLQLPVLQKSFPEIMLQIPAAGEKRLLVPYGNHARGSKFIDISGDADDALNKAINELCNQIPEFYFGRIDLRYKNWDALKKLQDFSIIELNGAGSEPTHIYDPKHSVFFAWKEIVRHWSILAEISILNHKRLKMPYMSVSEGRAMLSANTAYVKQISGRGL